MDPLYDPIKPARQGYVTVPLHQPGARTTSGGGVAGASTARLFFEVFSPPPPPENDDGKTAAALLPSLGPGRDPCDKVVLIMGAFCTRRMFEPLAAELARRGYHALLFDHRGVGASALPPPPASASPPAAGGNGRGAPGPPPISARLLALDALAVADHAFGDANAPPPALHVLGASMGGMVASELAVLLARGETAAAAACGIVNGSSGGGGGGAFPSAPPASRLASLTVMVSCRGLQPALWRALGISLPQRALEPVVRWLFPVSAPPLPPTTAANATADPTAAPCPSVGRMVERLMRDIVCPRLLATAYPDQRRAAEFVRRFGGAGGSGSNGSSSSGSSAADAEEDAAPRPSPRVLITYRDVYRALWTSRFHDLFCFADPSVGAAHTSLVFATRLSARKAAAVRTCGAPVLSLVATGDSVIAPRAQRELARMLGARVLSVPTGHVGLGPWAGAFYSALDETLRAGRVAMAAAAAASAGSSGGRTASAGSSGGGAAGGGARLSRGGSTAVAVAGGAGGSASVATAGARAVAVRA